MTLRTAVDSLAAVLFPAPAESLAPRSSRRAQFRSALRASLRSSQSSSPCACAVAGRFPTAPAAESAQPTCRLCQDNYYAFDFARSRRTCRPRAGAIRRGRGYHQAELIARPLARRPHLKQRAYLLVPYQGSPGAADVLLQRALGLGTWRLRHAQSSAG
jgi:hypothetical protein